MVVGLCVKYFMKEIEKTYLAKYIPPEVLKITPKKVLDIYFPTSAAHPKLRLRHKGDNFELTKKELIKETDASEAEESTIILNSAEFDDLSKLPGKRVVKNRYEYSLDGLVFEFDVFQADLTGLVVVEIEFSSTEQKQAFRPPDFCLADVTQEEFIACGMLAGKKYADIIPNLERFKYQPVLANV